MLDIRDWRRDLGAYGKLQVRSGNGSRGRDPRPRLVPAINEVRELLDWWMINVRHQSGGDYNDPAALFVNVRSQFHTLPVHENWAREHLGMSGQRIRLDRIFDEAAAAGGDLRVLAGMSGLPAGSAARYASVTGRVPPPPAGG